MSLSPFAAILMLFTAEAAFALDSAYIRIQAGEYVRGFDQENKAESRFKLAHLYYTTQDLKSETPGHRVQITRAFDLGATEVTVGQFREFVESARYVTDAEKAKGALGFYPEEKNAADRFHTEATVTWKAPGFPQTDAHPVVCVSLRDAQAYCDWLTRKTRLTHRLPTEAEWEYACRAGSTAWYSWGTDPSEGRARANLGDGALEARHPGTTRNQQAVNLGASEGDGVVYTAEVGKFKPNAWGLFDMHGNVWEWCQDRYQMDLYERLLDGVERTKRSEFVTVDPRGPETTEQHKYGDWRVIRGGSWFTSVPYARCSIRAYAEASEGSCYTGFRVLREVKESR
jgi:formylglycine-generating enzyme